MKTSSLLRGLAAGFAIAMAGSAFADHYDHYRGYAGPHRYYGPSPAYYGHAWYGGHWYHGWYGGSPGWWWVVGGTWFLYPSAVYPYPDPSVAPAVSMPAPPPGPPQQQYWYWCGNPAGYYPYVSNCGQPWQAVAAGAPAAAGGMPESDPPSMPAPPQFPPPGVPGAAGPAP